MDNKVSLPPRQGPGCAAALLHVTRDDSGNEPPLPEIIYPDQSAPYHPQRRGRADHGDAAVANADPAQVPARWFDRPRRDKYPQPQLGALASMVENRNIGALRLSRLSVS